LIANLLHTDGWTSWQRLDAKNRWVKEHVWAVLCASKTLPGELAESGWGQFVPASIRNDRELFLARMDRKEFAEYYNKKNGNARVFLPPTLRGDKQVVVKLVKLWPKILLQDVLTRGMLADEDVFFAFLESDHVEGRFLSKFSDTKIRGNATCMLEAAKTLGPVVLGHISKPLLTNLYVVTKIIESLHSVPPSNAFDFFSDLARYSKIVALALVRKNGLCLRDVDKSLHDTEMVRTACQQNPAALSHCLSDSVKRTLGGDKAFMLDIFFRLRANCGDPVLYRMLSAVNKLDCELIAAAYRKASFAIRYVRELLLNSGSDSSGRHVLLLLHAERSISPITLTCNTLYRIFPSHLPVIFQRAL